MNWKKILISINWYIFVAYVLCNTISIYSITRILQYREEKIYKGTVVSHQTDNHIAKNILYTEKYITMNVDTFGIQKIRVNDETFNNSKRGDRIAFSLTSSNVELSQLVKILLLFSVILIVITSIIDIGFLFYLFD